MGIGIPANLATAALLRRPQACILRGTGAFNLLDNTIQHGLPGLHQVPADSRPDDLPFLGLAVIAWPARPSSARPRPSSLPPDLSGPPTPASVNSAFAPTRSAAAPARVA
jgi:hypothetical protein